MAKKRRMPAGKTVMVEPKSLDYYFGNRERKKKGKLPKIFREISLGTAIRQLLWAGTITISLLGIMLSLFGTAMLWYSAYTLQSAVSLPLDSLAAGIGDSVNAITPLQQGMENLSEGTGTIADSLRNISSATNSVASSLGTLTSIPLIGGQLGGLSQGVSQLEIASSGLRDAADQLSEVGTVGGQESLALEVLKQDLLSLKVSILNAKKIILSSLGYLQIGIVVFGIALTAMLSSTLMLALSTGIPKEKEY